VLERREKEGRRKTINLMQCQVLNAKEWREEKGKEKFVSSLKFAIDVFVRLRQ
jgi:hypothetical protein